MKCQFLLLGEMECIGDIWIFKADDISPVTDLREAIISGIGNNIVKCITACFQCTLNDGKCIAAIMLYKIGNIFKEYGRWLLGIDYPANVKEQRTAFILKTLLITTDGEWLAGKSPYKHIKVRDTGCINGTDISLYKWRIRIIEPVCLTCIGVKFICPYDIKPCLFKGKVDTASTSKQTTNAHNLNDNGSGNSG